MLANLKIKLLVFFLMPICLYAQTKKYTEYDVKAAYLEKFTRFFDWPDYIHMNDTTIPFIIGILGETQVSESLENMYTEQKIKNKKVEIKYISDLDEAIKCNLLYISKLEYKRINEIIDTIDGSPVLTVCEDKRLSNKGIVITLFVDGAHVYFEIDKKALKHSGLYMNSLLFELSKSVGT